MAIFFCVARTATAPERPPRIFLIFQKVRFQPHRLLGGPRLQLGHDPAPTWRAFVSNYEGLPFSAHTLRTEKEKPWPPEAQGF
jgi:hypothetical protein